MNRGFTVSVALTAVGRIEKRSTGVEPTGAQIQRYRVLTIEQPIDQQPSIRRALP